MPSKYCTYQTPFRKKLKLKDFLGYFKIKVNDKEKELN